MRDNFREDATDKHVRKKIYEALLYTNKGKGVTAEDVSVYYNKHSPYYKEPATLSQAEAKVYLEGYVEEGKVVRVRSKKYKMRDSVTQAEIDLLYKSTSSYKSTAVLSYPSNSGLLATSLLDP